MFDAFAKQYYYDIMNDVDGNDKINLDGMLDYTDPEAVQQFFDFVYMKMKEATSNMAASSANVDPNVLGSDDDGAQSE
jgi:hypothetical protein